MQQVLDALLPHETDFWLLALLKLDLNLLGSVVEGTVVGFFTECDFPVYITGLFDTPFELHNEASKLFVNQDMSESFKKEFFDANGVFNLAKFLLTFENQLQKLHKLDKMRNNHLKWRMGVYKPCIEEQELQETKLDPEALLTHCEHKNHVPLTANTKIGPCLIYEYLEDGSILTADFVLQFPVHMMKSSSMLGLHGVVLKTIFSSPPPLNSLKHFRKYMNQDRILPEERLKETPEEGTEVFYLGLKLLNFCTHDYYIIRPGQHVVADDIRKYPNLRAVYLIIKILKKYLKIENLSSYTIKKILTLQQFESVRDKKKLDDWQILQNVYKVMLYPDLEKVFQHVIDYEWWKSLFNEIENADSERRINLSYIPLLTKAGKIKVPNKHGGFSWKSVK